MTTNSAFNPIIPLGGAAHHPALTEMVDVICHKTQNTDRGFYQVVAAYFLAKMASSMRAMIITKDRGAIPVNCYAMGLATSGFGKGYSINIIEDQFMKGFKKRFTEDTMPILAEQNLWKIANDRAARNGTDQQEEFDKVEREYKVAGAFPYTFDDGTPPAVKQLRHKLLLASCGSINLQIDEIGLNLVRSLDILTLFLELYDQGITKQKLIKNTADNQRNEEVEGKTPTNMLLFGTPSKLFDGAMTEDQFYSMLDTGYARRCLFGWGQASKQAHVVQTPEEVYANLTDPTNDKVVKRWSTHFHQLADPAGYGWRMAVEDDVGIKLLTYKIMCERAADALPEHEERRKAELKHRYFKALKLAGAYAFCDASQEVEMDHLMSAILLVEESGQSYLSIINQEKPHVRLAKYMADVRADTTHADLLDKLPFYPKGNQARNEMMTLATAWGYKNHIIIKKSFVDGIEFFKGEALEETDLGAVMVAYSEHWAYNYAPEQVPFDQLHQLTQAPNMHWANHHFKSGHRAEENVLSGFNLVVIDVDHGVSLETAHELLKDFKFLTYTTKRHQVGEHGDRFRIILPTNYRLELDTEEYKAFMDGIMAWLPFESDESANQRAKKWETFEGGVFHYNDGALLDVLPFIPKTSRNEQYLLDSKKLQSLDNMERWFAQRIASGNRNNQMIKYALALVDSGMDLVAVGQQVHAFNKKLNTPLSEEEIDSTILRTVAKKFQNQAA